MEVFPLAVGGLVGLDQDKAAAAEDSGIRFAAEPHMDSAAASQDIVLAGHRDFQAYWGFEGAAGPCLAEYSNSVGRTLAEAGLGWAEAGVAPRFAHPKISSESDRPSRLLGRVGIISCHGRN